jgi:hypothetical protein
MKIPEIRITNQYGDQPVFHFPNLIDVEGDSVFRLEMLKVFSQFIGQVNYHGTGDWLAAKVAERLRELVQLGIVVENPFENNFYTVCALSLEEKQ